MKPVDIVCILIIETINKIAITVIAQVIKIRVVVLIKTTVETPTVKTEINSKTRINNQPMSAFEIHGGHKLQGTIVPQGAKNEALQVLCAALLTKEAVTYTNVPDILDVNTLLELMADMGVKVSKPKPHTIILQADDVN